MVQNGSSNGGFLVENNRGLLNMVACCLKMGSLGGDLGSLGGHLVVTWVLLWVYEGGVG